MEQAAGTTLRAHGLRPLGLPRPIRVETGAHGEPLRVDLARALRPRGPRGAHEARWAPVIDVSEVWRVGEEWWREAPIRRTYYRLVVEDGREVTVFRDELAAALGGSADGGWFEQRY